jgi:DNA-binding beta-propeller fold protein YncE
VKQCPDPYDIFVNGDVYVACLRSGVIKISKNVVSSVVNTTANCPEISSVAINNNTGEVYVGCTGSSGGVAKVNNGAITKIVDTSQCPKVSDLFVDSNSGMIYIACDGNTQNTVIRANSYGDFSVLATSRQCVFPQAISVDTTNNAVYAACDGGIVIINTRYYATAQLVNAAQCPEPVGLSMGENKNVIYAGCNIDGSEDRGIISIFFLPPDSHSGLSDGQLLGIILGGIGGGISLFLLVWCILRRNRNGNPENAKLIQSSTAY